MSYSFDYDKFKRQNPRNFVDFNDDEFEFEYSDEFAFPDFDEDFDDFDNQ